MAAQSADVNRTESKRGETSAAMDGGAQTIYKGSLVMNDATGYAVSGADTASCVFRGVALEKKVIASTETDGTTSIRLSRIGCWEFAFGAGSLAVTDIGTAVFITTDNEVDVAGTTTNDVACGVIVGRVDADTALVDIEGFAF